MLARRRALSASARPQPRTHRPRVCIRASAEPSVQQTSSAGVEKEQGPPPGCTRYTVKLRKPLGLVLQQDAATNNITVAEVTPEGAASKTGLVGVGDQLIACSGVTYARENEYGEVQVKMGQTLVRVSAIGQSFSTIRAAIGSHPGTMEVTLELQRCKAE